PSTAVPVANDCAATAGGTRKPSRTGSPALRARLSQLALPPAAPGSPQRGSSRRHRRSVTSVDGDDLVRLVGRHGLVSGLGDDQHLLQPDTELVDLAVLG